MPTEITARFITLQKFLKENPDITMNDLLLGERGRSISAHAIPSDVMQLLDMMKDMRKNNISKERIVKMVDNVLDDVQVTYPKKYNVEFYLGETPPSRGRWGHEEELFRSQREDAHIDTLNKRRDYEQEIRNVRAAVYKNKPLSDYTTINPALLREGMPSWVRKK